MAELDTTILYISQYYAPSTAAAGLRAERFVRSLTQTGKRAIVITSGHQARFEGSAINPVVIRIDSQGRTPPQLDRTALRRWSGWRMLPGPDPASRYVMGVYAASHWAIERYKPRAIIVSGPPFSLMAAGSEISRETGLPLILEFRDAWYTGMPWPYRNGLRRALAKYWERRCLHQASQIITVTETCRRILAETYGETVGGKIDTVRHGYEKPTARQLTLDAQNTAKPRFTLAYTGQVRGIDVAESSWVRRAIRRVDHLARRAALGATFCEELVLDWMSPHRLIAALGIAANRSAAFRRDVRLVFAGEQFSQIDAWANQAGLAGNISQLGRVSPEQAQGILAEADALILTLYGIQNCEYHWCVPSKAYDYLASYKPILNLTPPGEASDLVNRAGVAYNATPDDAEAIADVIESMYQQHIQSGIAVHPDRDFIARFEITVQQQKYIQIVENVINKQTPTINREGSQTCVA